MRRGQFPLSALPAWCLLNDITFDGVSVEHTETRGLGLVAVKDLANEENGTEIPALLTIPKDLVLSAVGVEEYAKESKHFRQLLDTTGHQSIRGNILLFLLAQLVLSSPDYTDKQGVTTPWTQYFNLLPAQVPVPTLWSKSELILLRGTSLEAAVSAKLSALAREFDRVRETTADLPLWNELLNNDEVITLRDWILLDALYRSRSLGLPKSGESMVPCLDLVNHSSPATAYFEENSRDEVVLLLRHGLKVPKQGEITIDYGHDKSAAEMLFTYGFIDPSSTAKSIVLPLESLNDDPLAKAKLRAFGAPPTLKIVDNADTGIPRWEAPFVYLMCLNEEDGLNFKILQETDGSQHLRMFWQDIDVTSEAENLEELVKRHELSQVFHLRTVTVVLEMIQRRLEALNTPKEDMMSEYVRPEVLQVASHLRAVEQKLLDRILKVLEDERAQLFEDESVLAYLGSMEDIQQDNIDNEDFS
ncbi:hypothetical protein F5Y19DRAFT_462178 [Xylariaceae sp. FL1651]|nr:hypothetical protein F5Y19DRAFT_462178 [Xylariaceae sp. FL1651]